MPVDRDERGRFPKRCRDVFGADHADDPRPGPHQSQEAQADGNDDFVEKQTRARESPTGAGLLFVNRIAKAAAAFFFHGRHCREGRSAPQDAYVTIGRCKPCHCPPAPPKASILAAAMSHWLARGVYNYVINHPDDIKRVLLSNHRNYTKGEGMDRVKILLGNGIMTSEGDFWRRQRRMMQPAFHRRVIDQFSALIGEVNDKFAARWAEKAARAEAINLGDDTSELTLEIVLRSIFGSDLARLETQFGANPFEVVAKEQNRDLKFAFRFRSLSKLVAELIERRRRIPSEHFDFLSMLMATRDRESGAPMSDKELIDEVLTLIVAGHPASPGARSPC